LRRLGSFVEKAFKPGVEVAEGEEESDRPQKSCDHGQKQPPLEIMHLLVVVGEVAEHLGSHPDAVGNHPHEHVRQLHVRKFKSVVIFSMEFKMKINNNKRAIIFLHFKT